MSLGNQIGQVMGRNVAQFLSQFLPRLDHLRGKNFISMDLEKQEGYKTNCWFSVAHFTLSCKAQMTFSSVCVHLLLLALNLFIDRGHLVNLLAHVIA